MGVLLRASSTFQQISSAQHFRYCDTQIAALYGSQVLRSLPFAFADILFFYPLIGSSLRQQGVVFFNISFVDISLRFISVIVKCLYSRNGLEL